MPQPQRMISEDGDVVYGHTVVSKSCSQTGSISITRNLETQIFGPHSKSLNQKLWGWGSATCVLTKPPGDLDAPSGLRTTRLQKMGIWKVRSDISSQAVRIKISLPTPVSSLLAPCLHSLTLASSSVSSLITPSASSHTSEHLYSVQRTRNQPPFLLFLENVFHNVCKVRRQGAELKQYLIKEDNTTRLSHYTVVYLPLATFDAFAYHLL